MIVCTGRCRFLSSALLPRRPAASTSLSCDTATGRAGRAAPDGSPSLPQPPALSGNERRGGGWGVAGPQSRGPRCGAGGDGGGEATVATAGPGPVARRAPANPLTSPAVTCMFQPRQGSNLLTHCRDPSHDGVEHPRRLHEITCLTPHWQVYDTQFSSSCFSRCPPRTCYTVEDE
jgi:hypothetical protein